MNTVIGIVGAPASGKGTIAAYCKERYGAVALRFSDTLFPVLERLGVEPTRDNLIKLSEILRATFGEDVLARAIASRAAASDAPLVVVDGVRRDADVSGLGTLPGFHLVAVAARPELRYERSKRRREKPEEAGLAYDDFLALEGRSTEVSARELEKKAEVVFDNDGSIEDLHRLLDVWLASIGMTKR